MRTARIFLWSASGVLALLVGTASAVISNQVKYPSKSAALGVGPMGQVQANLAFASYAVRQATDRKAVVSSHERELASSAYRKEPLSSAALGLLIASFDRANDAKREKLLDLGGRLTRRSSLITSASVEAAARRNDEHSFFRWLSRGILTNESLRATYIGAMAQATARPGADATLAPVLGAKPSWSARYWKTVLGTPESLVNAAKLRIRVARAPWKQTDITDADPVLMLYLVRDGHFDTARQLSQVLGRPHQASTGQGDDVALANFSRQPLLPPMDWQLASSGNLGATIEPERKLLSISAIAGARGYAARRLVELAPGSYELDWTISANTALDKGMLTARLDCAEKGGNSNVAQEVDLDAGRQRADLGRGLISVDPEAC
ncbi:hypothetical protein [Sphingopyxis sp. 113P3]|uniref:hypothetical protein n=1 Tax=Sphingopyxis sp. (strain 113P3) TaxID=292913 RepID=UPI000AEC48E4|nr:hypothetical protein [Sphingopyxis sp. 113P3]